MSNTSATDPRPTWEVAHLFPLQGQWSESDFLELHTSRMVELSGGKLKVLPTPSWLHQLIVRYLVAALDRHIAAGAGGTVLFAPLPVRLFPGTIREPDVLYFLPDNRPSDPRGYPDRVDLVMEVVSPGVESRQRDYVAKRADYARGRVPEFWIVDPEAELITVLELAGEDYRESGVFRAGQIARSRLLEGLEIPVDQILSLAKRDVRDRASETTADVHGRSDSAREGEPPAP